MAYKTLDDVLKMNFLVALTNYASHLQKLIYFSSFYAYGIHKSNFNFCSGCPFPNLANWVDLKIEFVDFFCKLGGKKVLMARVPLENQFINTSSNKT